jgi:hypothetical protein
MLELFITVMLSTCVIFLTYKNLKLEKKITDLEFERFMQMDLERIKSSEEDSEFKNSERTLQ